MFSNIHFTNKKVALDEKKNTQTLEYINKKNYKHYDITKKNNYLNPNLINNNLKPEMNNIIKHNVTSNVNLVKDSFQIQKAVPSINNYFSTHLQTNNPEVFHNLNRVANMNQNNIIKDETAAIRKKGVKIITNVYQSKYNYNKVNCSGFGDFIRGCYFLLEFCEKYRFLPKIIFNNIIGNFLKIKVVNLHLIKNVLEGTGVYNNNNFKNSVIKDDIFVRFERKNSTIISDFIKYIVNKSHIYNGMVFLFSNAFPMNNNIPEKYCAYMRQILEPSDEMKMHIDNTLKDLNLNIKSYSVIHIRSGDSYLNDNNKVFDEKYLIKLIHNVENIVKIEDNYLIIADNNEIKHILKNRFPFLKMLQNEITHFGEGVKLEEEKVKNTLIDFYLLSHSKSIQSFTSYKHGSGFSYWCAKTYNIPYIGRYIH